MPRGGRRTGTPGKAYGNRTDLQMVKPQPIPGGQYGDMTQQQRVIDSTPQAAPTPGATAPPSVAPGSLGPLTAPTQRPSEPLTAGSPFGPGPNTMTLPPQAAPAQQQYSNARDLIGGLAAASPSPSLNTLLAAIQAGQ